LKISGSSSSHISNLSLGSRIAFSPQFGCFQQAFSTVRLLFVVTISERSTLRRADPLPSRTVRRARKRDCRCRTRPRVDHNCYLPLKHSKQLLLHRQYEPTKRGFQYCSSNVEPSRSAVRYRATVLVAIPTTHATQPARRSPRLHSRERAIPRLVLS
jgi:hypothetical protein